ncbi:LEM domain-containing protein 1 isoform X3 [Hyla sarda]|uniref:LEM domain-containing protein 1 isoform X3 n=1 Tax=Hyla sarda TaxID=327740 RepID=UPI0024C2AC68|nr:LEM domain-containing protein 1 isoform X3 [Hyla sarda]
MRQTAHLPQLQPIEDHEEQRSDEMELKSLSDSELKEQLKKHGVNPGPILPTTRTIYEKKLRQLLEEKQLKENGGGQEDQYSDSEDEGVQVKNLVDTGYELNGDRVDRTHSFDSYSHKTVPACIAAEFNQTVATLVDGFSVSKVLKKMERRSYVDQVAGYGTEQESKNLIYNSQEDETSADYSDLLPQSALVLSATRRKPIKGAAGRPIQFRYDDIATRARMQEQTKETTTEGKPQRLVSVRLQIVIFIIVAFIALVYITMESSPENPFTPVPEEGQQP